MSYRVAVRTLCEFTAKVGDLSVRFTPAPTARQGIAGHGLVAGRRGPGFERELPLGGRYRELEVRGRADGFDPAGRRLEEFKTHRGDLARLAANQRALHWAQLKVYGALLCAQRGFDSLLLALVYFDIDSERESVFEERAQAADLQAYFAAQCEAFLAWARAELRHRTQRDRFLERMPFPYAGLRPTQRTLAEAVYRCARRRGALMIQAPTGIGKTIGTLFPLLKAAPRQGLDKLLFLSAKTSGRRLALEALERLVPTEPGRPLRVLELVSKESACANPGAACEAARCPLASGFYDRLPGARSAALERGQLDQAGVAAAAASFGICPYYLTQELARWADVIVGDYNYYFDASAMLAGLSAQNDWRIGLLVDEAHNLLNRARDMYSASLEPETFAAARREAGAGLKPALRRVDQAWAAAQRVQLRDYQAYAEVPVPLLAALKGATAAISDAIAAQEAEAGEALLRFHFDALHFCRMADAFGSHSLFDITLRGEEATLCLRNVNPAPFLAPRFAASTTAVMFSATLGPQDFYRRLFGLSEDTEWLDVASPFAAHQLEVRVERAISTRFRHRSASLRPIAGLMLRQYRERPGNYFAFFSSFDYLQAALDEFCARAPGVAVWSQTRGMSEAQKGQFLENFVHGGRGIGFAVLGGVFAEGIDLPGDRLIGAFIATLGLPQVNEVNAEVERRMQELFSAGFEYTYLYPGLQKVVQAAGRVIRTESDRGTVVLMDDRYLGAEVRHLLPSWWRIRCS